MTQEQANALLAAAHGIQTELTAIAVILFLAFFCELLMYVCTHFGKDPDREDVS